MEWQGSSVNRLLLLVCLVGTGCSGTPQWATNGARQRISDAARITCTASGRDPRHVGVVVVRAAHTFRMEGESHHGRPFTAPSTVRLAQVLEEAGFRVAVPEMPWSETHVYDRSFEEALDGIAAAAGELRAQGAERVVLVGHSLGGGVVIGFGALRRGVDGIVALAAGPDPAAPIQRRDRADSVAKAEAMVAAGRANEMAAFSDFNMQYQGIVLTTPAHYLSFYSPDGEMSLHRNLSDWPPGLPLLWIDGTDEMRNPRRQLMVRSRLRDEPLTRYLVVSASHTAVADSSAETVAAWIGCL